jgi:hypothetical protein
MAGWRGEGLERIGPPGELQVASVRPGGALRKPTAIWVVRLGDDVFVRPVIGRAAAWFRATPVHHEGRTSAQARSATSRLIPRPTTS